MDFNIFLRRYKFLLFRLKDAAKRSESNPRDEVSGIATAMKNFSSVFVTTSFLLLHNI